MCRACYAMELGLRAYLLDVKKLVVQGVMAEIQPHLDSENLDEKMFSAQRKQALEIWNTQDHPLSYSNGVLPYLLRAVVPQQRGDGELTQSTEGKKTRTWFAEEVFRQCTNPAARRKPPFIATGDFKPVMRAAIEETTKWMKISGISEGDIISQIKQTIVYTCDVLEISHLPWSANDNASTTVVHDVYCNIGLTGSRPDPTNAIFTMQESGHLRALRTSTQMIEEDPRGEFSLLAVGLTSFATILHKSITPKELTLDNAGLERGSDTIRNLYSAIIGTYDGNKAIHQLALFCALVFAELAPNVFAEKVHPKPVPDDQEQLKRYISALRWSTRQRKGATERPNIITTVTVFLISWLDPASPLRAVRGDDLKAWNTKHSKHSLINYTIHCLQVCTISLQGYFSACFLPFWLSKRKKCSRHGLGEVC